MFDEMQNKLNAAREDLENAISMGWDCEVLTDEYPIRIIFIKNQRSLFIDEKQACITFTFTADTNTAIVWDRVEIKDVKKLKEIAENYAALHYKWFFMKCAQKNIEVE